MSECNCTLRGRTLGDGCEVCNPDMARDVKIDSLEEQAEEYRKDLRLIREAGRKGKAYTCACIADRALKEEK